MLTLEDTFEKYKHDIYISMFSILNVTSSSLINPCYNPPVSSLIKKKIRDKIWIDILKAKDFDFKTFIKTKVIKKVKPYLLFQDEIIWFLLLSSLYFNNKKKKDTLDTEISFMSTFLILMKYYTSLSNKHMSKFCDKTKAILALDTLSEKSLFSSKNKRVIQNAKSVLRQFNLNSKIKKGIESSNIALGMVHIMDTIINKYYTKVKLNDFKQVSKLIIIFRHRLSQSFKAYSQHYYDLTKLRLDYDDKGNQSNLHNVIQRVVNDSFQSNVYIPETQYKMIMQMTSVTIETLEYIKKSIFSNSDLFNLISNLVAIILRDGRYELLLNTSTAFEWLTIVKGLIAIRKKYEIRNMIMQIIQSDETLEDLYNSRSDSYKHKLIQSIGMVIGLCIYNVVNTHSLHRISDSYLMIV